MMEDNRDILFMQEGERKRIAEELHNNTVQDMVCLFQKIELAILYMDKDIVQSKLELILAKRQIKSMIDGIRDIIYNLRPMVFDDIGDAAAFQGLYDKLYENGFDVSFDVDNINTDDGITAVSVFHFVNEACQNVIKHSHADRVSVSVKCKEQQIFIAIADNGAGFKSQLEDNHFGISFMMERVRLLDGDMKIISNDNGTTINAVIPIK